MVLFCTEGVEQLGKWAPMGSHCPWNWLTSAPPAPPCFTGLGSGWCLREEFETAPDLVNACLFVAPAYLECTGTGFFTLQTNSLLYRQKPWTVKALSGV